MADSKDYYNKNQSGSENEEGENTWYVEEGMHKQGTKELDMPKSPSKEFQPNSGTWSRFIDDSSGFPYFFNEKSGERYVNTLSYLACTITHQI